MDVDRSESETRPDPTDADVEQTLEEVRAFLDDPVALLERATELLRVLPTEAKVLTRGGD